MRGSTLFEIAGKGSRGELARWTTTNESQPAPRPGTPCWEYRASKPIQTAVTVSEKRADQLASLLDQNTVDTGAAGIVVPLAPFMKLVGVHSEVWPTPGFVQSHTPSVNTARIREICAGVNVVPP